MFRIFVLVALVCAWPAVAISADVKGSRDHPMISRYHEATIIRFAYEDFDEYRLLTGPVKGREPGEHATLEGKVTRITYEIPKTRSTLEVYRNYEQSLAEGGFELLYGCADRDCGGRDFNHAVVPYTTEQGDQYRDQRYLAARLARDEGDIYAMLYIIKAAGLGGPKKDNVYAQLDVVEVAPMQTGMVRVDAKAMAKGIDADGHVALYGILFDFDSDRIRPESAQTLREISAFLESRPELKLLVVGHTDNQGALDYNLGLSRRRAVAVVRVLTEEYGIGAGRLEGHGVGFLAPAAPNDTEQGRAKNRRVELVKR